MAEREAAQARPQTATPRATGRPAPGQTRAAGTTVRRASISDVAAAAGVSRAAVSKVIRNAYGVSPAMRQRVDAAIAQLDYRPRLAARSMRGASYTIGFEVPDLGNDFLTEILHGAADRLAESSYQMIVAPGLGYLNGTTVLEALLDRQVDGVLAISSEVDTSTLERVARQVPLVLLGRHDESPSWDSVTGDDELGATLVMDHLLGIGHRRIAHLTIPPPSPNSPHAIRQNTYLARMRDEGLPIKLVHVGDEAAEARRATNELLSSAEAPTAIFAGHDTLALGCLDALHTRPDRSRVAVVGYDNTAIAEHPLVSLSSVDQAGYQMGRVGIHVLLDRLQGGRDQVRTQQMTPTLRIRASSVEAPTLRYREASS